jgi:hypothetical protein
MGNRENEIDLGHGHFLAFFSWAPDRDLNPQYEGIPDIPKCGARIRHTRPDGRECMGAIHFDLPEVRSVFADEWNRWVVDSWEPLTLSPSLLCIDCGDHGFIRNGKWEPA